ncbi:MAG TPA: N-acetylmuramoyl-L-alanine amidase, partial [Candidatus Binataceae bacterium]|nr:N-acetylmuramoyl-L-alanine amidase [Candidatus Binataceae bacterium]
VEIHLGFSGQPPRWNLTAEGNELRLDLEPAEVTIPPRPLLGNEIPPVAALRVIDRGSGQARLTIEVSGKTDYAVARLPHEILLRLAPAGAVADLDAPVYVTNPRVLTADTQMPARSAPALPSVANQAPLAKPGHALVMIDPGHGGYDPGTRSADGVAEKDLALQIAMRLQRQLESRGVRTELTRSSDVFVQLTERTRLANRASADLFVSIHLNSSPNTATSGIEVYYLNNSTDRATIRLARAENGSAPASYGGSNRADLNYILADLRQQYKASESASLARMIDTQTVAALDADPGARTNALGAKMGPFWVLVGAQMPAVLVECGFLSNPAEAARLGSARYQELLASGIASAVTQYLGTAAVGEL